MMRARIERLTYVLVLSACLLVLQAPRASAQAGPWDFNITHLGPTAVGKADGAAMEWNITGVGLFCGGPRINPGKINFYLSPWRISTNEVLTATVVVDGSAADMKFRGWQDLAVTSVSADFARRLMAARSLSVLVKDYRSPNPEVIKMDGSAFAIRRALGGCLQ